jgi:hypothetical protein
MTHDPLFVGAAIITAAGLAAGFLIWLFSSESDA